MMAFFYSFTRGFQASISQVIWMMEPINPRLGENARKKFFAVTAITAYRLFSAPILVFLVFMGEADVFKWLLAFSFFTDAIDGFLARKLHVTSVFGSQLDSIADDLTVLSGIIGVFVLKFQFVTDNLLLILVMIALLITQNVIALIKYKKITSFHTYSAKVAAVVQGSFLILLFFLPEPIYPLFYAAFIVTSIDLSEEIILVLMLPKWKADVKGIYWVWKDKK